VSELQGTQTHMAPEAQLSARVSKAGDGARGLGLVGVGWGWLGLVGGLHFRWGWLGRVLSKLVS